MPTTKIKLVMTLFVRDEEDILEDVICFHLNKGVDYILVADNGSIDGTKDILLKYKKIGVLWFKDVPEYTYEQSKWVSFLAKKAVLEYGATHLIHCDADEFWFPKEGTLKDHLPNRGKVWFCQAINYVPSSEDWYRRRWRVFTYRVENPLPYPEDRNEKDFLFFRKTPKVMSTSEYDAVAEGNHDVIATKNVERLNTSVLTIHHFPIRSYKQFKKRVIKGGQAILNSPYRDNESINWHIRKWYRSYLNGTLLGDYRAIIGKNRMGFLKKNKIMSRSHVPISIQYAKQIFWFRRKILSRGKWNPQ